MSGTISTTITTAVTLSVDATTITATGAVEASGAYYAVQGPAPTAWTLVNHGTVSSTDGGGVLLNAGGKVRNAQHASITGNLDGIVITGGNGNVLNLGTIAGDNGDGIFLGENGRIRNAAGGLITGLDGGVDVTGVGTVVNAGTILTTNFEGVYLKHGGIVSNAAGGFIGASYSGYDAVQAARHPVLVENAGTISGGYDGFGVQGLSGGYVVNQAGGSIIGGIEMFGGATVENAGVVTAFNQHPWGIALWAGGSVTNHFGGSISAAQDGILLGSAATILNTATIGGGQYGIDFFEAGGSVTNQAGGAISGGAAGIIETGYFLASLTIVNAGTISSPGGDAVAFASGVSNLLVVDPGAVFVGLADGGNAIGSTVASSLELASSSAAGTISGIGTQFIDFADITVDPGASWQFAGSNGIVAGQTLANSGTIDLTGTLALSGGAVSGGTLDIASQGTLSGFGTVTSSLLAGGGVVEAAGGTLTVIGPVDLASTGTLLADAGMLELTGPSIAIAGILDGVGAGEIAFTGESTTTIERGVRGDIARIDLFEFASLKFGSGFSGAKYGGTFDDTSTGTTTFDPGADNFTLSGADTFVGNSGQALITGSATLTLSGHTHLANATLGGTEALHNSGSLTETGQMTIGDASTSAATVSNAGTWDIANNSGIGHGTATTSSFTNSGIFAKTAGTGTSVISANFVNDGTIIADAGTLDFTGGFTNNGTIIQNGGTVIFGPTASPSLFNQYASGIDSSGANDALASPPPAPPQPTLAPPHPA